VEARRGRAPSTEEQGNQLSNAIGNRLEKAE
jgi:hypothetical protein